MSHTVPLRLNALLSVTIVALACLAAAGTFTDLFVVCRPHHDVSIVRVEEFQRVDDRFDDAKLALDLSYDLSSCASWNARAVHAQVTVGYETERRRWNEVTVWDKTATERKEMRRMFAFCWYKNRCGAVIDWPRKYIYNFDASPPELYDLSEDPEEKNNLYEANEAEGKQKHEALMKWVEEESAPYR